MFRYSRFTFLSAALLFVLAVSLARPVAVYADDGVPPPPATEEPAVPPTEEAPAESEPSSEAASDGESSLSETATAPNTSTEAVVVSEILEAAPEGTQVVILDENSEALPLTSTEAAEILAAADPIWCPAGVLPGGLGCTTNFASPQALIDDMDNSNPNTTTSIYEQDGIIYFTANPGGAFVLTPGSRNALATLDYNTLKVYSLTLQGGWSGVNGDTNFTQTDFGANHVQIGTLSNPWMGNITINNISISGVTGGANNTANTGLVVFTAGAINLNNVNSQNNAAGGALLDNSSGDKDVTVQNSSFNNNVTQNGLRVSSKGNITLNGVVATGNATRGGMCQ